MKKFTHLAFSVIVIVVLVGTSFIILSGSGTPGDITGNRIPASATSPHPVILSGVPDVIQAEYYSCGASSFQAVMRYYDLTSFETTLRERLNTTAIHGTYPWDMVRVARELGFQAEWKENLTLADLESSIRQGVPVIIDAQRLITDPNLTWEDIWDTGHYMVVIGIDSINVYLEDPALLGSRLAVPRDEFLSLWHDYESPLPVPPDARKYYQLGVFIYGTPPGTRSEFVNMTEFSPMILPPGTG